VAAWWGAVIATLLLGWDVIKWVRRNTPRLKIDVRQTEEQLADELVVGVVNIGEVPALIELVEFRCFARRAFFFQKDIKLSRYFCLFGSEFSPKTLKAGEAWQVMTGLLEKPPSLSIRPIAVRIDIYEAHARRPYRAHPEARRFLEWIGRFLEKK
jgi:hypothetical protein